MRPVTPCVVCALLLFISSVRAEVGLASTVKSNLKPALGELGPFSLSENFSSGRIAEPWSIRVADWVVSEGAAKGTRHPGDIHPPKLVVTTPMNDVAVRFSFKIDEPGGLDVYFYRGPTRVSIVKLGDNMAFGTFPLTGPSIESELGRKPGGFKPATWYTVLIERKGQKICLQSDLGQKLEVEDPAIAGELTSIMFIPRQPKTSTTAAVALDNVTISPLR